MSLRKKSNLDGVSVAPSLAFSLMDRLEVRLWLLLEDWVSASLGDALGSSLAALGDRLDVSPGVPLRD